MGENLNHMFVGTDAAQRRRADHFLQRLQRGPQGWGLADAILGGRTGFCGAGDLGPHPLAAHAVQFAAMTLHARGGVVWPRRASALDARLMQACPSCGASTSTT